MGAKAKNRAPHATDINVSAGLEIPPPQAAVRGRKWLRDEDVPEGLHLFGIKRGYRMGGTVGECLWGDLGLFAWHNQTLNSWTMIAGSALATACFIHTLRTLKPTGWDISAFAALWISPVIHLPFTVGYHQLLCMSPETLRDWRALDLLFIFVGSVPLTYSLAYFVFTWSGTLAATGVAVALLVHACHNAHKLPAGKEIVKSHNTFYVSIVVAVYLSPVLYQGGLDLAAAVAASARGEALPPQPLYSWWCALGALLSLVYGAVVYVWCFPDKYAPGMFDYVGSAQQLMHLGVMGAHMCEWLFLWHQYGVLHPLR